MGWREQVHIGELTCDVLIFSDQTIPGNRTAVIAIEKDAAFGISLTGAYTTNGIKVNQGSLKVHLHDQIAQTYNAEFKYDAQNVTGYQYGIDTTSEIEPGGKVPANRTAGGMRGVHSMVRVGAAFTLTGGYDAAIYGNFTNLGIINGGNLEVTAGYFVIGAGGTWTEVGDVCGIHVDSLLAASIGAGSSWMVNITNNGTTTWDAAIRVYAKDAITNFLKIDTASGMVGGNASGGSTVDISNMKLIKIDIDGTTHYMIAAQTIAFTGS